MNIIFFTYSYPYLYDAMSFSVHVLYFSLLTNAILYMIFTPNNIVL